MSFDGVATYAAVHELRDNLLLGKIEKIYQPQNEQLIIHIHTKQGKRKLLLSASGSHSAIYLTEASPENPSQPPVFCMVLRKHLGAGRITDIVQHENDRIVEILLETVNEMGFSVNRRLIIEIMGKHSNIILVDMETNRIIDSIKHISIDVNRARQILPGKQYEYPPSQEKTPFTQLRAEDMTRIISNELQPARCILNKVQGISPALAETLAASPDPYVRLRGIIDSVEQGSLTPIVYLGADGKPADFHITQLSIYGDEYDMLRFETFSQAASYYFEHRESSNILKQRSADLLRVINSSLDKLRHKMQKLNEDLFRAENSEKYRIYGELLTANLHMVTPGASSVTVTNYYDGNLIDIPLDPRYSPSRNAQNYYKKYGKAKTAVKEKKIQLDETSQEIAYLESVQEFTEKASSMDDVRAIRQELVANGFIRYRKSRKTHEKAAKPSPHVYTLSTGKRVLAGHNNKENDWLTLKKASSSDIWLHTKDIPGSHVILLIEGDEPTDAELAESASIAAFHSKAGSSENVPVDYTRVKYVKKPAGARPGMVIFTHNRTLYVNPKLPEE